MKPQYIVCFFPTKYYCHVLEKEIPAESWTVQKLFRSSYFNESGPYPTKEAALKVLNQVIEPKN
jgi:hypothetical protein